MSLVGLWQMIESHPFWTAFICMNVLAFLLMGIDKLLAKAHLWRIPERILMAFAVCFGAVGMVLGMLLFRHKTRKGKFRYGGPILIIVQFAAIYFIITTDWQAVF